MTARDAGVTVREVWRLALPPDTRLLGGEGGLDARVEWVASVRAAFPLFGALREGYLALAGLDLVRSIDATITPGYLLRELHREGARALVVDEAVAPEEASLADSLGLPLLLLPAGADLHQTEREILRTLVDREGQLARREMQARQHLQEIFDRGGVEGLLVELSRLTGGSHVVLRDAGGVQVAEAPGSVAETPGSVAEASRPPTTHIFSARAAGRDLGELVILGTARAPTPVDAIYARQAAEIAAVEMLQRQARLETEERLGADLVEAILDRSLDAEALSARLERQGYDVSPGRRHVVVAITAGQEVRPEGRALAGDLRWMAERDGAAAVTAGFRGRTLVLVSLPAGLAERRLRAWLQEALAAGEGDAPAVGISRPAEGPPGLHRAVEQAMEACDLGERIAGRRSPHYYDDLGLYRLLAGLRDQAELQRFCEETLGDLVRYDRANRTELLRTLEVFLEENANASRAARRLYVHRNTLAQRLQRIEDVTGASLDDAEARLGLQLALTIHRLRARS